MSGKYLEHFQFSVYKGECLVIQSLDTRMYNEFLEILEKEGGFKEVDMLVEGKKSIRLPDKKNRIYERRGNPDDAF